MCISLGLVVDFWGRVEDVLGMVWTARRFEIGLRAVGDCMSSSLFGKSLVPTRRVVVPGTGGGEWGVEGVDVRNYYLERTSSRLIWQVESNWMQKYLPFDLSCNMPSYSRHGPLFEMSHV